MLLEVFYVKRKYISTDEKEAFLIKCTDLENVFFNFYTSKENFELLDNVPELSKIKIDISVLPGDQRNNYKIFLQKIEDIL